MSQRLPHHQLRERLRRDVEPADPITIKLMQSLQLAAWAKAHSADKAEAHAYERQCFDFLLQWLGQLERPDLRSLDLLGERKEQGHAAPRSRLARQPK
jgi:hypothetical protein